MECEVSWNSCTQSAASVKIPVKTSFIQRLQEFVERLSAITTIGNSFPGAVSQEVNRKSLQEEFTWAIGKKELISINISFNHLSI